MALELNPGVLWRLGYRNMTRQQSSVALQEMYETLELAVGRRLTAMLTRAQQREYERLIDDGHDRATVAWLENHIPSYPSIVQDEYDRMLSRLEGALKAARRASKEQVSDDAR